jgi:cytochrome c-type biogenesis protein CcmE
MDPDRKRKIRLVVALAAAVLLATALVYTSFSASTEARSPSELLEEQPSGTSKVFGTVVAGSVRHEGTDLSFEIADREDPGAAVPVEYTGQVPDPFREGREVIVDGELVDGTLVADKDSLVTKCPSKFEAEQDPDNVIYDPAAS